MAARLAEGGHDVAFVGTPHGLEARLVPEAGIEFFSVPSKGFDRSRPWTLLTAGLTVLSSLFRATLLVRRFQADVIAGFGGYVSVPLGAAALLTRTPLVLAEQNSVPGLANRVLSRWARAVAVTYEVSRTHLKHPDRVTLTGNPVRATVLEADRMAGRVSLGLDSDALVLLVFGGSRGARHINDTMIALWPTLSTIDGLQVVHVAGRIEAASVRERIEAAGGPAGRYHVFEYIDGMGDAIAACDAIVARAGATSIAEITAIGRAAVLVPYPYATDDHQTLNARAVADGGGAFVIADDELGSSSFERALRELLTEAESRDSMAAASRALGTPHATDALVALLVGAARPE